MSGSGAHNDDGDEDICDVVPEPFDFRLSCFSKSLVQTLDLTQIWILSSWRIVSKGIDSISKI